MRTRSVSRIWDNYKLLFAQFSTTFYYMKIVFGYLVKTKDHVICLVRTTNELHSCHRDTSD